MIKRRKAGEELSAEGNKDKRERGEGGERQKWATSQRRGSSWVWLPGPGAANWLL